MTIFEIADEFRELDELVSAVDDEASAQAYQDLFASLKVSLADKLDAIAAMRRDAMSVAEAIDDEIDRLKARKAAQVKRGERLSGLALIALKLAGGKLKTPTVTGYIKRSESSEIVDEAAIPEGYWRVKREVAKSDALAALKAGAEIPGMRLVVTESAVLR